MNYPLAGALAIGLAAAGVPAHAGDADWYDSVADQKLVAVDDSTFELSPSEDGVALKIVSPNGVERDLTLSYVADGVGTVSDGGTKPVGVFRETDTGLNADFADGHTETFRVNGEGGVSMMLSAPRAASYCMRWYPDGHAFDVADRKAALAAYASKLGLSGASAPGGSSCAESVSAVPPKPVPKPHRVKLHEASDQVTPTQPVFVRVSQVHPIDPPAPEDAPPAPAKLSAAPAALQPVAAPAAAPAELRTAQTPEKPADPIAEAALDAKPGEVASSCLVVDSNGTGWGFRNSCGYAVQFAYCLKNGSDKSAACGSGSGTGDVKANGFALVLDNNEIITAQEEFRWVACAGTASQVAAHLDRPDPPAGRCVPVKAM